MNVNLVDKKCIDCGTRLTQFELEEKLGLCMECSKDREIAGTAIPDEKRKL